MVMAPRGLAVAAGVCRTIVVTLSSAACACTLVAPEVNFSPMIFMKATLVIELFWHAPRLVYDAAQVFFHAPLPPHHMLLSTLVVTEWVMMLLLFASGSSAMAVVVFFQKDTGACRWVHPEACSHWHAASAVLTLWAWFFSLVIAVLMFFLRASPAIGQQY